MEDSRSLTQKWERREYERIKAKIEGGRQMSLIKQLDEAEKQPTKDSFLKSVKDHKMTILKDDDLYLHLKFDKNGSSDLYFEIIAFPNGLLIRGYMGAYEFEHVEDMLGFFQDREGNPQDLAEYLRTD